MAGRIAARADFTVAQESMRIAAHTSATAGRMFPRHRARLAVDERPLQPGALQQRIEACPLRGAEGAERQGQRAAGLEFDEVGLGKATHARDL